LGHFVVYVSVTAIFVSCLNSQHGETPCLTLQGHVKTAEQRTIVHPTHQRPVYQLHIIRCGTIIKLPLESKGLKRHPINDKNANKMCGLRYTSLCGRLPIGAFSTLVN